MVNKDEYTNQIQIGSFGLHIPGPSQHYFNRDCTPGIKQSKSNFKKKFSMFTQL